MKDYQDMIVPGAKEVIEKMKYELARELGVSDINDKKTQKSKNLIQMGSNVNKKHYRKSK